MNKKFIGGVVASALIVSAAFSGCSFTTVSSEKNMNKVIANVDLMSAETEIQGDFSNLDEEQCDELVTTADVYKRDLIAYFLNAGYSYVQSGYAYSTVFNMLVDSLTETEIMVQYATLYLANYIVENSSATAQTIIDDCSDFETMTEKYEYLLNSVYDIKSENETYYDDNDIDRVMLAEYTLCTEINSSIDSYEQTFLDEDDTTTGSESRATPANVDTEIDNYYPVDEDGKLDYAIYTGYGDYTFANSGKYKEDKLDGSTRSTRIAAYNSFVKTLKSNYLITDEDEDIKDVRNLVYIKQEYENQLKEQMIEQFTAIYEQDLEDIISSDDYLNSEFNNLLGIHSVTYDDVSSFESAYGSMSDSSFILYSPSTEGTEGGTFGYVYNILLPFSATQNVVLSDLSDKLSNGTIDDSQYYVKRNELLKDIKTTDQRSAYFNGSTDYSFKAKDKGITDYYGADEGREYLFFENNLTKEDRYESLDIYTGLYSYNGNVYQAADDSYILKPNELTIDDMLNEFEGYLNYVMGENTASSTTVDDYYDVTDFTYGENADSNHEEDDIDYTKLIYAYGQLDLKGEFSMYDLMNPETDYYKAMSAVNELQYAYTTDTSVLSQYVGYTVSAYDTSYIKEFETAAKAVIGGGVKIGEEEIPSGVGSYIVCAGDYGWHLIYVTAIFSPEGGYVYGDTIDWSDKDTEGTFANIFYNYIKDSALSNVSTDKRTRIITEYKDDSSVVLYEKQYKDLLDMDT